MSRSHPSNGASSRGGGGRSSQPFNHSRRSWTNNGMHYTMETASYDSPGLTFNVTGGSAGGLLGSVLSTPEQPRRRHASAAGLLGAGLLGTAVNLLGAVSEMRHANREAMIDEQRSDRRTNDIKTEESSDDDLAYGSLPSPGRSRPRSVFSRVRDRLGSDRDRGAQASQPPESARTQRAKPSRGNSYRTEYREPSVRSLGSDSDFEIPDDWPQKAGEDRNRQRDAQRLSSLEDDVEDCAHQVRRSRRKLERASGRSDVNIAHLQQLLDEVKVDERSLADAQAALRDYKYGSQRSQPRKQRREARPAPQRQATGSSPQDDLENAFPGFGFGVFPSPAGSPHGLFADLMAMHMHDSFANVFGGPQGPFSGHRAAFAHDAGFDHFFAMPGFAAFSSELPRQSHPRTTGQGSYQKPPGTAVPQPAMPAKPPNTIMTPSEAQRLYTIYNERWNALAPSNPVIPYPARGLKASALTARDTLWAPNVSSPPSTWSDETVMQANAQSFFLNVVGLTPQYTEAPGIGRVEMGFDKGRASPAQVKQLVEMLKKEKGRWHSDRLGRRNGGDSGPNEALQTDERARAVFHAVCELMEKAQ